MELAESCYYTEKFERHLVWAGRVVLHDFRGGGLVSEKCYVCTLKIIGISLLMM